MLRGIFMPSGVSQDVVTFYVELFKKVRGTAEWKKFMEDGAFNQTFMAGKEYVDWVAKAETLHRRADAGSGFPGGQEVASCETGGGRSRQPVPIFTQTGRAAPLSNSCWGTEPSDGG